MEQMKKMKKMLFAVDIASSDDISSDDDIFINIEKEDRPKINNFIKCVESYSNEEVSIL